MDVVRRTGGAMILEARKAPGSASAPGPVESEASMPDPARRSTHGGAALHDLLAGYASVLRAGEECRGLLWIRTRPPTSSPWARWVRLPHPTLGLRWMVVRHVTRSVDALSRSYARRAALGELDAQGLHERQVLADFRAGLPPVPWKAIVLVSALAGLVITRALAAVLGSEALRGVFVLFGAAGPPDSAGGVEVLARVITIVGSFASVNLSDAAVVLTDWEGVELADALILLGFVVLATYLVLRSMSAVFRVKRMLFNLCDEPPVRLARTTSTWHVPRSTGVYAHERDVFRRAGCVAPREPMLDLGVSLLAVALVAGVIAAAVAVDLEVVLTPSGLFILAYVVLLPAARFWWLVQAARARRGPSPDAVPQVLVLPATARVVDRRSPLEVLALVVVAQVVLFAAWEAFLPFWLLPSTVCMAILVRLRSQAVATAKEVSAQSVDPSLRRRPLVGYGAVVASFAALPLVVAVVTRRAVVAGVVRGRVLGVARALAGLWVLSILLTVVVGIGLEAAATVAEDPGLAGEALMAELLVIGMFLLLASVAVAGALVQHVVNEEVARHAVAWPAGTIPAAFTAEFHVPPSWPAPPSGWRPGPGFAPEPEWGPAPEGWQFWHVRPR
ncbi:hypothetical protein [Actinotalea sp. K2]|uniref:hypothetical protein n=1 Tax=Actinotalea sp. K2 TaxID=2939438 RepID=UPI002016DEFE|nr:hypothetical protein [Actinotalea sp. K2]MCL3861127.1 hypothetical protein [Actinotalea sp. K2]